MDLNALYYVFKPFIPRCLQIAIRRLIVLYKRSKYADVWPIDEQAGKPPEGWTGWPEGKKFALVLTHDVETGKGVTRCKRLAELEEELEFRSCFNFMAGGYAVPPELRNDLIKRGFEVGVHGLYHRGNLFESREKFKEQAVRINQYLKEWGVVGFRAPSMYHNLDWIGDLDIQYDSSTFDTDPFEPQPDGAGTIFPFWVPGNDGQKGYVEIPYTLPQDFTLFVLMKEKNIAIWKQKLDWVVRRGGMVLLDSHPDYMSFDQRTGSVDQYPVRYYEDILHYIKQKYHQQYWLALPRHVAEYLKPKRIVDLSITKEDKI